MVLVLRLKGRIGCRPISSPICRRHLAVDSLGRDSLAQVPVCLRSAAPQKQARPVSTGAVFGPNDRLAGMHFLFVPQAKATNSPASSLMNIGSKHIFGKA